MCEAHIDQPEKMRKTPTHPSKVRQTAILAYDITERERVETELNKYRSIFENSIEGIFQTTPEGRLIAVNAAMAKIHGFASPEEMMEHITDIADQLYVNAEDRRTYVAVLHENEAISNFEVEQYRKDRTKVWVSLSARAVRDVRGDLLYYEGNAENITARKHLEAQLLQARKMEAVGTLAGGIAHDFNNILTVITGYGTLLQMQMDKENPLSVYVDQILAASEKATNLTQGLLAFSRQQPISLHPVKVNEAIKETEKLIRRLITEDIMVRTILTPDDPIVMADPTLIDKILFNLATNARDAMPKGGTLTIETEVTDVDNQFTGAGEFLEPGRYTRLSVTDTGTGIDETTREHIFDPFFTTKEVDKGTGLGLSAVYGVIRQHKGHITVHSEKNVGTTFHIYLPVARASAEEQKPSPPELEGGAETILVAEDNEEVRGFVKSILTRYGYKVIEAVDGEDALTKFRSNASIDLLIVDSVMPKKNGRDVYDEIVRTNPDTRVLFTSGYTRDVVLDKGIQDREFHFISKPLAPEKLLQKVREVIDQK